MFLDIPRNIKIKEKLSISSFTSEFKDGIAFIKKRKDIITIITLAMIINFAGGSISIGILFISKMVLRVSDFQYGMLETVAVIGTIVSTFLIGWLSKKNSIGKNIYIGLIATSLTILGYAFITLDSIVAIENSNMYLFILTIIISFIISLFCSIGNIFVGINFQYIVPLELMGRVSTVMGTGCMIAVPLSNIIYGYFFDKISASIIFFISGISLVIIMLLYKRSLLSINTNIEQAKNNHAEVDIEPA